MGRWALSLLAVLIITGCAAKGNDEAPPDTTQEQGQDTVTAEPVYKDTVIGDFTLMWRVDTLDMLHVKLSAPTTGWVAVGFRPGTVMKDANFIIGYVADGQLHIQDEYGTGITSHQPDIQLGGEDNLVEAEGEEKEGRTHLHFAIPLDSGDSYDRVLQKGKTYKVLLAYGVVDNFLTKHRKVKSIKITI